MQSPYYSNANLFSPSVETLNAWMKTRKSENPPKPGLYETVDHSRDSVWVTIAIFIELSAIFLTIYGALLTYNVNHKFASVVVAIVIVFLFVAFDIIGILLHGHDRPEKVILKSKIKIERDQTKKTFLLEEQKKITIRTFVGIILLLLSGVLKIVAIANFFKQINAAGLAVLILFYLVVIYIHIFHTGYWLAAREVKKLIDKDYRSWHKNNTEGIDNPFEVKQPHRRIFESSIPMPGSITTFNNGRQKINFLEKTESVDGATIFHYELLSIGCLWDEEVSSLIMNFSGVFSNSLIDACIALQLSQINEIIN